MEDSRFNRLQKSAAPRPTVQQVFTAPPPTPPPLPKDSNPITPGLASIIAPVSPPDVGNIFGASAFELPAIPTDLGAPLLDSAVEISDTDDQRSMSAESVEKEQENNTLSASPTLKLGNPTPDRSHSFSFGQTVFRSAVEAAAETSPVKPSPTQRNRAFSDTIFTTLAHSPVITVAEPKPPEASINDNSKAVVAHQSNMKERDPFAANASTYYTPGTMLPPSPPQSTHTRTASREEDLIWSLRTQLAVQSELCAQYQVDLSAKDELVEILNSRLGESEKELERRKNIVRNWRKRVTELEKCVKMLEEEVDRSREVSADRSVMDEASSEALRMLHCRINDLERENQEADQRERDLQSQLKSANARLAKAQDELQTRDESDRELQAGINAAKEEMEQMGRFDIQTLEVRERLQSMKSAWEVERTALVATNDALRNDQLTLQSRLTGLREEVVRKEEELAVLKAELEAQWRHTEQNTDDVERLRKERDALAREADELRGKLTSLDAHRDEHENRRRQLERELEEAWVARDELGRERQELEKQLRAEQNHTEELTRALQEREDRVSHLEQERKYAYDSMSRLQENLRQRDAELAQYNERIREAEAEAEELRDGLTRQKREHARIVDGQSRKISEVVAREVEARHTLERLVREKAEDDGAADSLKERVTALQNEVDKLRKQVHVLQQESADKEVKLAQAVKQRAQDKEDMQGLNIALDSKQQELELLKRRMGTRASISQSTATKPAARRESSIFTTPSVVRPSSAMSDASSSAKEPATVTKSNLTRRPPSMIINAATKRMESVNAPTARPRSSLSPPSSATTSRPPSSYVSRSNLAAPLAPTHRRMSSSLEPLRKKPVSGNESGTASASEKENIKDRTPVAKTSRRQSVVFPS
ncbi:uncharacterized protein PHACADRAFT_261307 [Phanerochaete carnosa HHB-10118-sp]|uniref:Uncharacterized protein n=1 Tax=Phanerochaete carnosa (strain HHB-10118-sp) TaxID=650164 RepID=K5US34_PHACS|nr:uncharacterized protein PHACADRAFT_261307 [Phanerochaete carnosa HHB-10118-sp]EKM52711.1 hypothetical protein PHACADRAFT_261307 [Phanerochaete carnosa HHB-10118-sp]